MISKNEALDNIGKMFVNNKYVHIERNGDEIIISQEFCRNAHIAPVRYMREKKTFSHIVTLTDTTYRTIDTVSEPDTILKYGNMKKGDFNINGCFYDISNMRCEWNTNAIKKPIRNYLQTAGFEEIPSLVWHENGRIMLMKIVSGSALVVGLAMSLIGVML